jgi:hypothetical protein
MHLAACWGDVIVEMMLKCGLWSCEATRRWGGTSRLDAESGAPMRTATGAHRSKPFEEETAVWWAALVPVVVTGAGSLLAV